MFYGNYLTGWAQLTCWVGKVPLECFMLNTKIKTKIVWYFKLWFVIFC